MSIVEELTKALCKASGCHHLCSNTEGCVVEEEARAILDKYEIVPKRKELPSTLTNEGKVSTKDKLLLINENKSNNFEVKSNKQIEEMANDLYENRPYRELWLEDAQDIAEVLYNAGYRKQSEGEWVGEADGYADGELVYDVWHCSECNHCIDDGTDDPDLLPNFCPNCGAKMSGGKK